MRGQIESWSPTVNRLFGWVTKSMGIGMLGYELVGDKLHNPTAVVVGGALAGAQDLLGYASSVREQARQEHAVVREAIREQILAEERERAAGRRSPGS